MAEYTSPYSGYTRVIRPADRIKENNGKVRFIPGKKAKFENGRFRTSDPEIINVLDNIARAHPDVVVRIDKKLDRVQAIREMLNNQNVVEKKEKDKIVIEEKPEQPEPVVEQKPKTKKKTKKKARKK